MKCILLLIVIVGFRCRLVPLMTVGATTFAIASANAFRVSLSVSPYTELMFMSRRRVHRRRGRRRRSRTAAATVYEAWGQRGIYQDRYGANIHGGFR